MPQIPCEAVVIIDQNKQNIALLKNASKASPLRVQDDLANTHVIVAFTRTAKSVVMTDVTSAR